MKPVLQDLAAAERGLKLLSKSNREAHPRRQVKSLRKIAQLALNKGDNARAREATEAMVLLNDRYNLGFGDPTPLTEIDATTEIEDLSEDDRVAVEMGLVEGEL